MTDDIDLESTLIWLLAPVWIWAFVGLAVCGWVNDSIGGKHGR